MGNKGTGFGLIEVMIALIALVLVGAVFAPFRVVEAGERGIRVTMGKASDQVLPPGMHFKWPLVQKIVRMGVQIQKTEVDSSAGTKDLQEIKTHAALNWHVSPQDVVTIYRNIGENEDIVGKIIQPAFNEVTKAATAKKTAEEVLGRRQELKSEIDSSLAQHLKQYGILVDDVNIVNVSFTPEFAKAVEEKQVAEQHAKKASYIAEQAKAEAQAEVNRARGQAAAQDAIRTSITPALLRLKAIEKWDGKFPQVMGSGSTPFVDLRSVVSKENE